MSASPLPAGIVLHDKVTFITGGNAGIGRAIAERFAEHGAQLVLFDRDEKVIETAEELRKDGRRARGVAGDVSHAPDVKQAVAVATAEFGRIDILGRTAEPHRIHHRRGLGFNHGHQWIPLIILIVSAGLASLPEDVIEAAKIDGASYAQRLFRIVLPMLSHIILIALLIRSMDAIRFFDAIALTTNGGPVGTTKVVAIRLYETAFRFFHLGYAAAIGLTMLIFTIMIAKLFLRALDGQELTR